MAKKSKKPGSTKPPMKRRKLPRPLESPPLDVTPPEPPESPLKISGSDPEPPTEDEDRNSDGTFAKGNQAGNDPVSRKKKSQSLQMTHSLRGFLGMTPQQFEVRQGAPETVADELALVLLKAARSGTMDAIKTIYERTEGRVPQALEVNNNAHKDVNERVGDISRNRANAAAIAAAGGLPEDQDDVEVPSDGADSSEGTSGKPGVAESSA